MQICGRPFSCLPPSVLVLPDLPVKQDVAWYVVSISCANCIWNQDVQVRGQDSENGQHQHCMMPLEAKHIRSGSQVDGVVGVSHQSLGPVSAFRIDTLDGFRNGLTNGHHKRRGEQLHEQVDQGCECLRHLPRFRQVNGRALPAPKKYQQIPQESINKPAKCPVELHYTEST